MRREVLIALMAALACAGCVADGSSVPTAAAPRATPAEPADAATLVLDACEEMQARFAFPADNYPQEALPPGFALKPNPDGTANVVAIARACQRDGASSDTFVVLVEVEPPAHLAREGATHGFLLDLWADEPGTADAFRAWGFGTLEERDMTWDKPLLAPLQDPRMRSEDFVLTIHLLDAPASVPHASLRVFEVVEAQVRAAFDVDRPEGAGPSGPATATFVPGLPSQGGIDMPFHERGEGTTLERGWDARHAPVAVGPAR